MCAREMKIVKLSKKLETCFVCGRYCHRTTVECTPCRQRAGYKCDVFQVEVRSFHPLTPASGGQLRGSPAHAPFSSRPIRALSTESITTCSTVLRISRRHRNVSPSRGGLRGRGTRADFTLTQNSSLRVSPSQTRFAHIN